MTETCVVESHFQIHYDTKNPVPIDTIIDTLVSMERMLKRTPAFMEAAYKGMHILETEVLVSSIVAGSLTQDFVVKYVFGGKDNYDQAIALRDKIIGDSKAVRTVVAIGIGALIGAGTILALPDGAANTTINAHNNTVVNIGGQVSLSSEDIKGIIDGITDKKGLAKDAVTIIAPAKTDASSTISIGEGSPMVLSKEFIAETPKEYIRPVPAEREAHYQGVEVVIYASDRDKMDSGWAGIVPGVVDSRVPIHLAEGIDPAKLHGRTRVKADIVVHERFVQAKKNYQPKMVELRATN